MACFLFSVCLPGRAFLLNVSKRNQWQCPSLSKKFMTLQAVSYSSQYKKIYINDNTKLRAHARRALPPARHRFRVHVLALARALARALASRTYACHSPTPARVLPPPHRAPLDHTTQKYSISVHCLSAVQTNNGRRRIPPCGRRLVVLHSHYR